MFTATNAIQSCPVSHGATRSNETKTAILSTCPAVANCIYHHRQRVEDLPKATFSNKVLLQALEAVDEELKNVRPSSPLT